MKSLVKAVIGSNLKRLREAKGLSQEELAHAIKVEHPSYNRWENGVNIPSDENSKQLAAVLGIKREDLLLPSGKNPKVDSIVSIPPDKATWEPSLAFGAAVLDKLASLSALHREVVLALLFSDPALVSDQGREASAPAEVSGLVRSMSKFLRSKT